MNNNCVYFVESDCEEKLINALKRKPELILTGKVIVHNLIQNYIPKSRLLAITPETKVVFVFDTDVAKVKDITKSKSNYNFKGDFCKLTDARSTLTKHQLDILSLWTQTRLNLLPLFRATVI